MYKNLSNVRDQFFRVFNLPLLVVNSTVLNNSWRSVVNTILKRERDFPSIMYKDEKLVFDLIKTQKTIVWYTIILLYNVQL